MPRAVACNATAWQLPEQGLRRSSNGAAWKVKVRDYPKGRAIDNGGGSLQDEEPLPAVQAVDGVHLQQRGRQQGPDDLSCSRRWW